VIKNHQNPKTAKCKNTKNDKKWQKVTKLKTWKNIKCKSGNIKNDKKWQNCDHEMKHEKWSKNDLKKWHKKWSKNDLKKWHKKWSQNEVLKSDISTLQAVFTKLTLHQNDDA